MIFNITNYHNKLSLLETEKAIKFIKDGFQKKLASALNLTRVSAPLFVFQNTGLNDDLNGVERKVEFSAKDLNGNIQVVQSLAKWKRNALHNYGFGVGQGIYTDMNAIRRDEDLDNLHSIYVDQWDWEKVIRKEDRNLDFLFDTVKAIYQAVVDEEREVNAKYTCLNEKLPDQITFISTEELEERYPNFSRKERENKITEEYHAVFLYRIGWPLKDGLPHDGRAADYDDWNLNGDILLYNPILHRAFEISSMGIRVDAKSIQEQLKAKHDEVKLFSPYTQNIIMNVLPLSIGGGIGQSRLCMYFLEKAHIGEVHPSLWSDEDKKKAEELDIHLL
ncbi:MAG: aspartate--ammonia ligase [Bacilli bacterium]|nr:aspartate--ammonia ligase [Bacilli bacterium]